MNRLTKKTTHLGIVAVLVLNYLAYETDLEHVQILAVRYIGERRVRVDLACAVDRVDALERIDDAFNITPSPNKLHLRSFVS
jgi:hypothetical protein